MRLHIQTFLFAAISVAGIIAVLLEFQALRPETRQMNAAAGGSRNYLGLSLKTTQEILFRCTEALAIPGALLRTGGDRNQLAQGCAHLSERALAMMPTNGLAHLVRAMAFHHLGEGEIARRALTNSMRFAPSEGWLAERRFGFAAESQLLRPPDFSKLFRNDVKIMLATQSGAELLATYCVRRPGICAFILDVARTQTLSQQVRLEAQIRRRQAKT